MSDRARIQAQMIAYKGSMTDRYGEEVSSRERLFSGHAFTAGAKAALALSDTQWKQEREAISRTVDPLAWRNIDHFMAEGKDLRFCWLWIKTPLRRADDVLWLLGFTRTDGPTS